MLSQSFPFLEAWMALIVIGFLLYVGQNATGRCEGKSAITSVFLFVAFFVLSAMMFSAILIPLAALMTLAVFVRRAKSKDRWIQGSSLMLLAAFILTAGLGLENRQRLGDDYPLSCIQAGQPGRSFFVREAKQDPFPTDRYLRLYREGSARQAYNVMQVFRERPSHLSDEVRARELSQLKALVSVRPDQSDELKDAIYEYEHAGVESI